MQMIINLLDSLGLPTSISIDAGTVLDTMERDKKRIGEKIDFVLLNGVGSAFVERMSIDEMKSLVKDLHL